MIDNVEIPNFVKMCASLPDEENVVNNILTMYLDLASLTRNTNNAAWFGLTPEDYREWFAGKKPMAEIIQAYR